MRLSAALIVVSLSTVARASAQERQDLIVRDPCAPRGAPIPSLPAAASTEAPPPAPYVPLRGLDSTFDLGIGHLRAESDGDADWFRFVEVPVYPEPGSEPSGWIVGGWWVPAHDPAHPVPLTTGSMVETGYEVVSWIVVEARDDGWVRFRFASQPEGSGWASLCHLTASDPPIVFESWLDRFTGETAGPLFFRTRERHALRRGPGTEYPRSFWLVGYEATELHPLEIRGDWMRVRTASPPLYCADPPPARELIEEGWIRWRDDVTGPWIWWFTRGC